MIQFLPGILLDFNTLHGIPTVINHSFYRNCIIQAMKVISLAFVSLPGVALRAKIRN